MRPCNPASCWFNNGRARWHPQSNLCYHTVTCSSHNGTSLYMVRGSSARMKTHMYCNVALDVDEFIDELIDLLNDALPPLPASARGAPPHGLRRLCGVIVRRRNAGCVAHRCLQPATPSLKYCGPCSTYISSVSTFRYIGELIQKTWC